MKSLYVSLKKFTGRDKHCRQTFFIAADILQNNYAAALSSGQTKEPISKALAAAALSAKGLKFLCRIDVCNLCRSRIIIIVVHADGWMGGG